MTNDLDSKTLNLLLEQNIITEEQYNKLIGEDVQQSPDSLRILIGTIYHEYIKYLKNEGLARNTIDGYTTNAKKYLEYIYDDSFNIIKDKHLQNLDRGTIVRWFEELNSEGYSSNSLRRFKHSLKKFFEYISTAYTINTPNVDRIEISQKSEDKITNVLTDEEIRGIAERASTIRGKCIILVAYEAGLRRQELIDLEKADVDLDNNTINVFCNGKLDRVAIFTQETGKIIKMHIDDWNAFVAETNQKRKLNSKSNGSVYDEVEISKYLFQTLRSPQISYSTFFKAVKDASYEYFANKYKTLKNSEEDVEILAKEKANKINTETLRHSRRAYWFSEGKTLEQVQAIMGDENRWVCKRFLKIAQQLYPYKFV
jgi:site-specific recombinase XerD